jgi:transcription antitermination factor NusG
MDYKNWYALSINMNKEKSTKAELLARKRRSFKTPSWKTLNTFRRKEIVVDKGGRRKVKNALLMSGYLLVKVKPHGG